MIRSVRPALSSLCRHHNVGLKLFATQVELKINEELESKDQITKDPEWDTAIPYKQIPGPSKIAFLKSVFPGGKYYKYQAMDLLYGIAAEYGSIFKLPGMFGKLDSIVTLNPDDFEKVFRTEGIWPLRRGSETLHYYRTKLRSDVHSNDLGLITSQGKDWGDFRSHVNQIMMQPKTAKLYIPTIDEVANDFVKRIHDIRDPLTFEVPENFEDELNRWACESIGTIALDTRLGLIGNFQNENAAKLIRALKEFFELGYKLETLPSLWKFISTPTLNKMMKALDTLTEISTGYIEEAKNKIENGSTSNKHVLHEESVLGKLLKINPQVAKAMAMDMMFGGVDTTTTAVTGFLYLLAKNPDKQEILRKEVMSILPEKNTLLTTDSMNRMPYLRACIKETLRLLPVTIGNLRAAGQDIVLSGYQVPKGVNVGMIFRNLLRQDNVFHNAMQFEPERWLKDSNTGCPASTKSAHSFSYLPFGFGKRMCIGRRIAEMEIEVLATRIIRNFNIEWKYPDIKFKSFLINFPDCKLTFTFNDASK